MITELVHDEHGHPVYNCLDCDVEIKQSGTPIGKTGVLGYQRYCDPCIEIDLKEKGD